MNDVPETPSGGSAPVPPPPPPPPPPSPPPYDDADAAQNHALPSEGDERNWAMLGHLSALIGAVLPTANIWAPLIVWQMKKDTMPFAADQAREALNFNITAGIAALIALVLKFVLIGFLLFPLVVIAWLVLTVIAALAASRGEHYRYPFALRLVN